MNNASTRDLVNHGAAGKGDKPRTRLDANYRKNFDRILWYDSPWSRFGYRGVWDVRGQKLVKKYA